MLNLTIGVATCGRKEVVNRMVADIIRQSELPDKIILAPIDKDRDIGELNLPEAIRGRVSVLDGPPGLTAQRNTILKNIENSSGIILFLDDDFVMHKDYCKELRSLYQKNNDVVGVAGYVIADGINSTGIEYDEAVSLVNEFSDLAGERLKNNGTTYGCNMSFRLGVIQQSGILFDEKLPLYGWFEDLDFSAQMARFGKVVNTNRCVGVHLGHKSGRTSGVRLGYSQVVNPFYMWKKGTMPFSEMAVNVGRRFSANLIRSTYPEPWIDRKGRVRGNLRAFLDILTGNDDPQKILKF